MTGGVCDHEVLVSGEESVCKVWFDIGVGVESV